MGPHGLAALCSLRSGYSALISFCGLLYQEGQWSRVSDHQYSRCGADSRGTDKEDKLFGLIMDYFANLCARPSFRTTASTINYSAIKVKIETKEMPALGESKTVERVGLWRRKPDKDADVRSTMHCQTVHFASPVTASNPIDSLLQQAVESYLNAT